MEARAQVGGESLILSPERAAFWEAGQTLFVADVHLGKAASFRAWHIPVPGGTNVENLRRLHSLVERFHPRCVAILGDLWHAKEGRTEQGLNDFGAWRRDYDGEVLLVAGNHDRRSGPLPPDLRVREVEEGFLWGPFALRHHVPAEPKLDRYALCGHLHPAVRLDGKGRQSVRLPAFWFGLHIGVLPAFGEFTGTSVVRPSPRDTVYAVAEGEVVPVQVPQAQEAGYLS